ncbi:MAG: hypothetical protein LBQ25_08360 [Azonexus sp.]|nr:hypothetical protein [Azonexus sp.]
MGALSARISTSCSGDAAGITLVASAASCGSGSDGFSFGGGRRLVFPFCAVDGEEFPGGGVPHPLNNNASKEKTKNAKRNKPVAMLGLQYVVLMKSSRSSR